MPNHIIQEKKIYSTKYNSYSLDSVRVAWQSEYLTHVHTKPDASSIPVVTRSLLPQKPCSFELTRQRNPVEPRDQFSKSLLPNLILSNQI